MEKSLIEEPDIDLLELFDEISDEAATEKLAIPPINKMVYYWTRKPLIVGRAVALMSTLKDIELVREFLGLGSDSQARAYTRMPNKDVYKEKLGMDPSKIKVLDPFGGGGNLIYTAKRLGLDCTCSDYNPLAHLLQRAVLEFPVKYGKKNKLKLDFEKYSNKVIKMTFKELKNFYKKDNLVYYWSRCIKCPHCSQRIPLVNNMWLANNSSKKIAMKFHVTKDNNFITEIIENATNEDGNKYTVKQSKAICIKCKNGIDRDEVKKSIINENDHELNAIKIQEGTKRKCVAATDVDRKLFKNASNYFSSKQEEYEKMGLIPNDKIRPSHRDKLSRFEIMKWSEYFNNRQILTLTTLLKNIRAMCNEIEKDCGKEYAGVMSVYLAFLLAQHATYNSMGVSNNSGRPGNSLSMRMPPFLYSYAEVNSFVKAAGSLENMAKNITDAINFVIKNNEKCRVEMSSVTKLDQKYDLIITDPPYGWDVQYGETSDFLYVWIHRCIKKYYEELPQLAPLDEDFCVSLKRFENKDLAFEFFNEGFKKSFQSINKALKDDGLLVVFFAHSGIDAWNTLLESIRSAKLRIVSSYAIHTESKGNPMARNKTAFLSSIIITCRKITEEKTAYIENILPDTEDRIKEMIRNIYSDKFLTLPITDLMIMVYGQVLEVCTSFTELKTYSKGEKPDLQTVIKNSQEYILKEIIMKLTGKGMNLVDPKLSFFLLTRIFYGGKISSDDAIKISKVSTMDKKTLESQGVVKNADGVTQLVPLHLTHISLEDIDLDAVDTYDQLCYICKICSESGVGHVRNLISQGSAKLKLQDLKDTVSLLVKSGQLQRSKGRTLQKDEKDELKILETVADMWGISGTSGKTTKESMDVFMK